MTTWAVSSHESSCLANCRPLNANVHCRLVFVMSVQEASVRAYSWCHDMTGSHRDHLFVASFAQQNRFR